MTIATKTKLCTECEKEKTLDKFTWPQIFGSRLVNICRECMNNVKSCRANKLKKRMEMSTDEKRVT